MSPALDETWLNDRSEFQRNFVHGLRNPHGLHLQYWLEGERTVTRWTPEQDHAGFPGFAHGGLVAAVLDDVMGRCAALHRVWVVTGKLDVRFRNAAPLATPLRIEGWIERLLRRAMHASGRAVLDDGTVVAEASATYLPLNDELRRRMVAAWPGFSDFL